MPRTNRAVVRARLNCGVVINEAPVPIKGVIFDFHATLVDGGDADRWIDAAFRRLAEAGSATPELTGGEVAGLRAYLDQIWQHAHTIDPASERDLSPARHWDVFSRTLALCPGLEPELIAALYAVMPDQWAVYEDALAGVAAGRAGHFALVVGVDRVGQADQLRAHGADAVVKDLAELL